MSFRRKPGLPGCRLGLGVVCLIAMSVPASELRAQDGPGQHEPEEEPPAPLEGLTSRAAQAPVVDGVLDDAAWQAVPAMTDFIQREPFDGQPASERTEVRLVYDDAAIYVGVWAWDGDADAIIPGDRIRDTEVSESDAILLAFDTYHDYQNAFVFGTTPAGIEYDGQVANEGRGGGFFLGGGFNTQRRMQSGAGGGFNKNWDGSWNVATSRDGEGWYAEFRIPFNTLRYGNDPIWGFNVSRQIRRRNEESFWSAVPREFNLYRLNYAGHLTGLELPFRRLGSVTPYLLGSAARDYAGGQTAFDRSYEFGGEAKLQITQGITLDATYNTDFAQVEVDDQQVNLTRFSLLFPEKRPFFLENAGFFAVGGGGADLFFSRRIGIANGRQAPITGGVRVSGRAAGFNVGLLQIATDRVEGVTDPNAYSVVRVARELPNRSRIGAAFINRDGSAAGDYNRTYAVDGQLGLGEAWTLAAWGAQTETPGLTRADQAFDATFGLNTRKWRGNVQYQYFGEDFNPEVGFLRRAGHNYYQVFLLHNIHPGGVFRELRPHVSYFTFRSDKTGVQRGFEESARLHIDQHWEFQDGMEAHTGVNWVREGVVRAVHDLRDGRHGAGRDVRWVGGADPLLDERVGEALLQRGGERRVVPVGFAPQRERHRDRAVGFLVQHVAAARLQRRQAGAGGLRHDAGRRELRVFLHAPDLSAVARPVLDAARHLLRQRAFRVAEHCGDRPVHRLQRHPGHPGSARTPGSLADPQVQPPGQRLRRLTAVGITETEA